MAVPEQEPSAPQFSERIQKYRREIEALVKQGGEQPQYEFKRTVFVDREHLDDRLDFIKFIQAVANAEISTERCIVIGADPKEKKFYPLSNADDFDRAKLSAIISAYLYPTPQFESFSLETDAKEVFVILVLNHDQPRPIVVVKEGRTENGKNRLDLGDVWIKKDTGTIRATRDQLDLIYRERMEVETEDRARKRFKHFLDENLIQPSSAPLVSPILPNAELLVGPRQDLANYFAQLIANDDLTRFVMLVELARETLVEGWDAVEGPQEAFYAPNPIGFLNKLNDFYKNRFSPVLDSVVECGILGIKNSVRTDWIINIVDLFVETFNTCGDFKNRLGGSNRTGNVAFYAWRPAFDCFLAVRAMAIYTVLRSRLPYLETILPKLVKVVSSDLYSETYKTAVVLWPFINLPIGTELRNGRAQFFWKDRISGSWGRHFHSASKFLDASCQFEFLLEFNSFLGTNSQQDPKFGTWLQQYLGSGVRFHYLPDLYSQDLHATVPMAERIYDLLSAGSDFPSYLVFDPKIVNQAFSGLDKSKRLEIYGDFLYGLKSWQSTYLWEGFQRMGFMWDWEGRLKQIADPAAQRAKLRRRGGV
jgi:hypothetical protein